MGIRSFLGSLWFLARPRLMPFIILLPLVGYGWAHWDRALPVRGLAELPLVLLAWMWLQAGTMWLNAALDRDLGEVLMARSIAVPAGTAAAGYLALVGAAAIALFAGALPGVACGFCGVLSVLYSHPATAWKSNPILGPLVNALGYGLASTFAGWAIVDVPPDARTLIVWLLGCLGVLGCYFAVQAFQGNEDRRRGYRTLVATHGPGAVLLAARVCMGLGWLGGVILAAIGWLPRLCLVACPLGLWVDHWLSAWSRQPSGGNSRWASGLAWRLLLAGLAGVALAYVDYFVDYFGERPVAGLGTRAGHPPDTSVDEAQLRP